VLRNGLQVVIANRPSVPVVRVSLLFNAGYVADQGRKLGTSSFAMSMLDEGTRTLGSPEIADRAERLGAELAAGSSLDSSFAALSALRENLDASLALFADVVRNPSFPQKEIDRVRKEWIAGIAREKQNPALAMRVLPPLLYGEGHPYAIPFSGPAPKRFCARPGRPARVPADWLRPDDATIIVTGDAEDDILPLLEKYFGDWGAPPRRDRRSPPVAASPAKTRVYLIDKPTRSRPASSRAN
jgi:predicted Zn-dependent peptidase